MWGKRFIVVMLTVCVALAAVCFGIGSANTTKSTQQDQNPLIKTADNEIGSYSKIDRGKTQLVIGIVGTDDITALVEGFEHAHPDVQPIIVNLQVGNLDYSPAAEWVKHGYAPDIVFNLDLGKDASRYQVDLTSNSVTSRYTSESLENLEQNGHVYSLPGPSKVMAIAYNKTLFSKYGWSVPANFDEFIDLCDRIEADTNGAVRAYSPNAKYVQDYTAGLEGFTYGSMFSGVEKANWYRNVLIGKASLAGHMEPYFATVQTLIDRNLLTVSDFNYSYTTRTKEFQAGNIAMMNVIVDSTLADTNACQVGYMEFPATNGGDKYLVMRTNYNICEIIRNRTDAQAKAANEFLDYISTVDAQNDYIGDSLAISHVNGVGHPAYAETLGLSGTIDAGHLFESRTFTGGSIPSNVSIIESMRAATLQMAQGTSDVAAAIASCDAALQKALSTGSNGTAQPSGQTAIATIADDFTVLETSEYIADAFRERTGADIALIPDNSTYRGNIHRMFAGDATVAMATAMLPRSFDNGAKLVKVQMTGAQLMRALNDAPDYGGETADCVYAFSGLKATVKPYNEVGKKYLAVTLADGSSIEDTAVYTVAFWDGMVRNEYIASTVETYEGSYPELLSAKLKADKSITPTKDGRMTLVWN